MKNVEVTLYRYLNGKRVKVETILTDSKGNYLFDGLQPGDYQVEFELPDGYVFTKPNVDPKVGSDTKPDGTTVTITILENQDNLDIWAGLYPDKEIYWTLILTMEVSFQSNRTRIHRSIGVQANQLQMNSTKGTLRQMIQKQITPLHLLVLPMEIQDSRIKQTATVDYRSQVKLHHFHGNGLEFF